MRMLASLLLIAFSAIACAAAPTAAAQTPVAAVSERERLCFQRAAVRRLVGGARERFLSECLKPAEPQACGARDAEADRQTLKGKSRKLFMSGCVKRGTPPGHRSTAELAREKATR